MSNFGIASATCPTCGYREHIVRDFIDDDEGCLVSVVLECQSCLNLSAIEH